MAELRMVVSRIACVDSAVVICGEIGTGKTAVAEAIHFASPRSSGPLVACPCDGGSEEEVTRELFEKCLPEATGGTLLLEEVGALSPRAQVQLLYHLQEKKKPGLRVIATTVSPLSEAMAAGRFRRDLYFMLHVVPLEVPPLRKRLGDLPMLVDRWSESFARRNGTRAAGFTAGALDLLRRYPWPGNLRELEAVLERAVVLAGCVRPIEAPDFSFLHDPLPEPPPAPGETSEPLVTLDELERRHVLRALEYTRQNRTRAAHLLNISVRTLRNKLHQYRNQGLLEPVGGGSVAGRS